MFVTYIYQIEYLKMAEEKIELIAMKEYLQMLMECTIPISFYGEIFEGQEAKVAWCKYWKF